MNKKIRIATAIATFCLGRIATAGDLTVQVDDVKAAGGQLMVAVYSSADGFLKHPARAMAAEAKAGTNTIVLHDVAPGEYAVAVYHDQNANGKLDRNPMGMPTEDFGFSNNAMGRMGPPSWEQARFNVTDAGATARISFN